MIPNKQNMESFNTLDNFDNVLGMEPEMLLKWLNDNFSETIPTSITTVNDLRVAGKLLGQLTNIYSYLISMSLFAKLKVREAKRNKIEKDEIDKCVDRKEIISQYAETIKCQYSSVSRMITVKQQIDEEMKMI